jgi:hypothetical protein
MSIIPALRRMEQEDLEFEVNICHIVKFCLEKNKTKLIYANKNVLKTNKQNKRR